MSEEKLEQAALDAASDNVRIVDDENPSDAPLLDLTQLPEAWSSIKTVECEVDDSKFTAKIVKGNVSVVLATLGPDALVVLEQNEQTFKNPDWLKTMPLAERTPILKVIREHDDALLCQFVAEPNITEDNMHLLSEDVRNELLSAVNKVNKTPQEAEVVERFQETN